MRPAIAVLALVWAGCRPQGLPALPVDRDAADPRAPAPKHEAPAPLTRSAFDGIDEGNHGGHGGHGGHDGHGQHRGHSGHRGHAARAETVVEPAVGGKP